jgi:hypothetical protein
MKAASSRRSVKLDSTVSRSVTDRICSQVLQYLFQPVGVSKDRFSARLGDRREGDLFPCAVGIVGRDHIAEQLLDRYGRSGFAVEARCA